MTLNSNSPETSEPSFDLTISRRRITGLLGGSGILLLAGCGGGGGDTAVPATPDIAPVITVQPQSQAVSPGTAITLQVGATGTNLAFQWRRNGLALAGANGNSLLVTVAAADQGARYTAVVSNATGQVESQAAVITLLPTVVTGISLLAGGLGGISLLEGRGSEARLQQPDNVAVSKDGVVYFTCGPLCGKVSAQGDVSFIGGFPYISISGLACDSHGDLYACAAGMNAIYKLVDGVAVTVAGFPEPYPGGGFQDGVGQAARLHLPASPAFDSQDNLYFVDRDNCAIRKVAPNGAVTTVAGSPRKRTMVDGQGAAAGFAAPSRLVVLKDGSLVVMDDERWRTVTPDGWVTTMLGSAPALTALAGNDPASLYGVLGHSVVRLSLDRSMVTVAGSPDVSGYVDGDKDTARFNRPVGLALSGDGQLFVADYDNAMLRRVDPGSGRVSGWGGAAPQPGRIDGEGAQARFANMGASCIDRDGNVYVVDTSGKSLRKVTSTGVTSTLFADFPSDGGLAVDASGNFYGVRNRAIVKVSPSGAQQLFAGQPGVLGYADGLGSAASFAKPMGLVVDAEGNLLVGDSPDMVSAGMFTNAFNYTFGTTIRKITPSGLVSTIAGVPGRIFTAGYPSSSMPLLDVTFVNPTGLVCDAAGTVWILDASGVRRTDQKGGAPVWVARNVAGHPLAAIALAADPQGDILVADTSVIRKVRADGSQTVVAGIESADRSGVRLGALPGSLGQITGLVAGAANVLYCCSENSVLRIQLP